jgi:predicted alpha/beta-fold hydrolase
MDLALNYIKNKYPDAPLFAVGTSFGANMLLRWSADKSGGNNFL